MGQGVQAGPPSWIKLGRRIGLEWLGVSAALLLLTFALSYFGGVAFFSRLDHAIYDFTLRLALKSDARHDIVIVAIDDNSIAELGYWPWPRSTHARLLARLGQARAVGMDIVFNDENPAYPADDQVLADAIKMHGRVVLPLVFDATRRSLEGPLPVLSQAASGLGRIDANLDRDGVIRSVILERSMPGSGALPHFGLAMVGAAGEAVPATLEERVGRDANLFISYTGGPRSFTMYPYSAVLDGSVPEHVFHNKYVLVGSWATGLGDALPTPFSGPNEAMAGVEVLANILQSVLDDSWIRTPGRLNATLLALLPVLILCLALRWLSPRRSFALAFAVLLALLFSNWLLISLVRIWIPPAASMVGVILAYPVWSWRSQEAALQHIDGELEVLQADRMLGLPASEAQWRTRADQSLSARVIKLHQSVALLRQAVRQREEVLRFISHDMRSPQNSILALIELQRAGRESLSQDEFFARVEHYARGTLGLVDGFVHLARAEVMSMNRQEQDLVALVATVCDERWPQAIWRQSTIQFHSDVDSAYARVDGGLISRAVGNLLDNALQYSPEGSVVRCKLTGQDGWWRIAVQDDGPGIAADRLDTLFMPFTRLNEQSRGQPSGSGLGLAFVHTVMQRHGGSVECVSLPGQGSEFICLLPAEPARA